MNADRMPASVAGRAWRADGTETVPSDPQALAGYPTRDFVDRAMLLIAEMHDCEGMPTDEQVRWALGVFAITEGATRTGEAPDGPAVMRRLVRYDAEQDEHHQAMWPERFHEGPEQRMQRRAANARLLTEGGESHI